MSTGILKYDLGAQEIGFVNLPPDCADRRCRILLTTREDGGLGIARIENSRLHLWSSDGVLGWAPSGVIELEILLPVRANNTGCIYMVSFVHGLGAFFVRVNAGAFTVEIVSSRVRKVADNRRARCFVPYTSFCIPGISSITFLNFWGIRACFSYTILRIHFVRKQTHISHLEKLYFLNLSRNIENSINIYI
jgi:hypothetical protein